MALRRIVNVSAAFRGAKNAMKWQRRSLSLTVDEDSWAAELVRKQGGRVVQSPQKAVEDYSEFLLTNPSDKVKNLIDEMCKLTVAESVQLSVLLSETLGVSFGVSNSAPAGGEAAPVVEAVAAPAKKEIFDVKLGAVDAKAKLKIIKEVRTITGLGLKEAKELVEKAPVVVKTGLKTEEAEEIKKVLVEAGAEVELV